MRPAPPPPKERLDPAPPQPAPRAEERADMVRLQLERRDVSSAAVLEAMRKVPRHEFVPQPLQHRAYDDNPLPIGHGQTISQPYIVGYMTQALALKAGDRVLEIGTGSGYQAAVLAELTPHVYTIEIIKALGEEAAARLKRLGYKTVEVKVADGYFGWEEKGPFDAIIVTCAAGSVPPPLLKQLKPGGRMCIPVGPPGLFQDLVLVTKDAEGKVRTESLMGVAFVPLTREVR
ncbi:MAG TPA: protein-L-isoaspartate(D-aspartate) O-methyltransferase [Planctomycetota bacterium]|nr:protein-L-isoaspartate(D-aspartate) O-methyltransferase [Planctomycetota bacterium]HRR83183.1 protein-L-isoaspartate(D-aspartate) O-methyltransferase [Planctomycetota bacterium]HRT97083.1 protein-L-isoaspartate(D-aspartate) O-methyltransferase [Planctomycetota bacterium]